MQVWPQTQWWFQHKDLSIDERVGAWFCVCCWAYWYFTVWFILFRYSVVCTVESLSLFHLLFISWFICTKRWFIDKLGLFLANQKCMCINPGQNYGWWLYRGTILSHPVIFLLTVPRRYFFCGSFLFAFVILSLLCLAALWAPAGKVLTSWLSCMWRFVVILSLSIWCPHSGVVYEYTNFNSCLFPLLCKLCASDL